MVELPPTSYRTNMKSVFSWRIVVSDSQVTPESRTSTLRSLGCTTGFDGRKSVVRAGSALESGRTPKLDALIHELFAASVPSPTGPLPSLLPLRDRKSV